MNEISIGYIEMIMNNNIFTEAEIGTYNSGKSGGQLIRVSVYNDEGDYIPHIHFIQKQKVVKIQISTVA